MTNKKNLMSNILKYNQILFRNFLLTNVWKFQVAIKTLIVIHRTLREGDPTFKEELVNYSRRGYIFQLSNFKDDSSPLGK